jgi:hypothetical protein
MTAEEHARGEQFQRGPGWRIDLARCQLHPLRSERPTYADAHVLRARQYLQARKVLSDQALADAYADLVAAERLDMDHGLRASAKILVLADSPPAEIATLLGLDVPVIAAWEALYFDVRAHREAFVWVYQWVIYPEEKCGNYALAAKLKFASALGPVAARSIVDPREDIRRTADNRLTAGAKLFDDHVALMHKMDQALAAPLDTERGRLRFLKMAMELNYRQARLQFEARRLEVRAEEARRQLLMAETRRAQAERRAQQDARRDAHRKQQQHAKEGRERHRRELAMARERAQVQRRQDAIFRGAQSGLAQLSWERPQADPPDTGDRHQEEGKHDRHQAGKRRSTTAACGIDSAARGKGRSRWTTMAACVSPAAAG